MPISPLHTACTRIPSLERSPPDQRFTLASALVIPSRVNSYLCVLSALSISDSIHDVLVTSVCGCCQWDITVIALAISSRDHLFSTDECPMWPFLLASWIRDSIGPALPRRFVRGQTTFKGFVASWIVWPAFRRALWTAPRSLLYGHHRELLYEYAHIDVDHVHASLNRLLCSTVSSPHIVRLQIQSAFMVF